MAIYGPVTCIRKYTTTIRVSGGSGKKGASAIIVGGKDKPTELGKTVYVETLGGFAQRTMPDGTSFWSIKGVVFCELMGKVNTPGCFVRPRKYATLLEDPTLLVTEQRDYFLTVPVLLDDYGQKKTVRIATRCNIRDMTAGMRISYEEHDWKKEVNSTVDAYAMRVQVAA